MNTTYQFLDIAGHYTTLLDVSIHGIINDITCIDVSVDFLWTPPSCRAPQGELLVFALSNPLPSRRRGGGHQRRVRRLVQLRWARVCPRRLTMRTQRRWRVRPRRLGSTGFADIPIINLSSALRKTKDVLTSVNSNDLGSVPKPHL